MFPPPATASAEGAQLNGPPSPLERVRVRGFSRGGNTLTPRPLPEGEGARKYRVLPIPAPRPHADQIPAGSHRWSCAPPAPDRWHGSISETPLVACTGRLWPRLGERYFRR